MWIGTVNGLNRYDGHHIKQYFHSDNDSFSLPGNAVFWIQKDEDGDMWFSCGPQGMAKYNYEKDRFERLPQYEKARRNTRYNSPVWRIFPDRKNGLYIACGGNLFQYEKRTGNWKDLTPLFNGGIDDAGIGLIIPQGKEKEWILTDAGLFLYNLTENKITPIPFDTDKLGYGVSSMHGGVFINDDEILISMARPGFVIFNTRTWQFRPAPAPVNPANTRNYNSTGGVVKDRKGRIWLANSAYGLMEYFPLTNTLYSVKNEPNYPYPFLEQEGIGLNVFEDRDGNIWYGNSLRGVVWFQPQQNFVKVYQRNYASENSLGDDHVFDFSPATGNGMFIATAKGLSRFDITTGNFINFPRSILLSEKYPGTSARSVLTAGDTVFICTDQGLSIYYQQTGLFQRYVLEDDSQIKNHALFANNLSEAYHISAGELILRSQQGKFARFDTRTGKCFSADSTNTGDSLYSYSNSNSSLFDSKQHLFWVETGKGELHAYNTVNKKEERHYFTKDTTLKVISAIAAGSNGSLWLGTNIGIFSYDPSTKQSRHFILPGGSQDVFNVAANNGKTVWITTSTEIIRLDAATGSMRFFNIASLVSYITINKRSLFVDANNNAWIGSDKGFCIVSDRSFDPKGFTFPPHLISVNVLGKQKLFDKTGFDLTEVQLEYNENFFSFEFSAFDYSQTSGKKYSYKLEPFDKEWKIIDGNSAGYTNVPPGTYHLMLRVQNGPDKWVDAKPVKVVIHSPYWKKWWFLLAALAAVVYALYRLIRYRRKLRVDRQVENTISYFANSKYGENSVNEICWDIARNCISQLEFEDCVVYLFDEKKNALVQMAAFGPKNPQGHEIDNPLEIEPGKGIVGAVAQTAKALRIDDTSKDSRYIVDDEARLSELAVPILHDGKVIGVIDSEHTERNFFTAEHEKALGTIASISANKIAEAMAENAAKEKEIKLLEINKLLAESQLMALRAQMNPHFVFNCLNSIQECIVTQKYGEASNYLNKFSKLFRMVLNNSGKKMVSIEEESEVLRLYLDLEHMRFEKSFDYRIDKDEALDSEEIMMPSMLVQPYVENALWHGLMHKDGERKLLVKFEKVSEDVFRCIVDDNGIGRKRSFKLKQQQSKTKRHESKGLKISSDRVEILQKQGYHASLEIIDKYNEQQEPAGTLVIIELSTDLIA